MKGKVLGMRVMLFVVIFLSVVGCDDRAVDFRESSLVEESRDEREGESEVDPFVEDVELNPILRTFWSFLGVVRESMRVAYFTEGKGAFYYAEYLMAMGEPSISGALGEGVDEVYRFGYFRSSDDPIVVRLTRDGGVWRMKVIQLETDKKHDPVRVVLSETKLLGEEAGGELLRSLAQKEVWSEFSDEVATYMAGGKDGSSWVFEKRDASGYRMMEIWSPDYLVECMKEDGVESGKDLMMYHRLGKLLLEAGGVLPVGDDFY